MQRINMRKEREKVFSILGKYKSNAVMAELNKSKLKKEYQLAEFEILVYTKGRWKPFYFLRHVLRFLRQYPELCEQSDYKELYDETITLLLLQARTENSWTQNNPTDQQGLIELFANLQNKNLNGNFEYFTIEIIDDYLAYRKKMWERGKKHTKERYGFIS